MELVAVGLNHKSAPVDVRETLAFNATVLPKALATVSALEGVQESVILSTCNRSELYIGCADGQFRIGRAADFLAQFHQLDRPTFEPHLYEHVGLEAVRHLFQVTSSIDSMVVGETQILNQVKGAYLEATRQDTTGKFFNRLFQTAFRVAKRAYSTSRISDGKVSVSSVAVEFAERIFEQFAGKTAMVIGAGEMSELTLTHLRERGIGATVVANRTYEKAVRLAEAVNGRAVKFDAIEAELSQVDIVIASSGAPHFVILPDQVRRAMRHRGRRPILFIDIALPRDIHPEVNRLDNVYVYGLDDLQTVIARNLEARAAQVETCRELIDREVESFAGVMRLHDVEPLLAQLTERMAQIGRAESARAIERLGPLTDEQKKQIAYMADRLVRKIMHKPLETLRDAARGGQSEPMIDAARRMFGEEPKDEEKR